MLIFQLLGTGMNPAGLWRCLRQPPCIVDLAHEAEVSEPVAESA
jgi:hypothetical protein